MNVIQEWRNRARNLRGEYFRCGECGALSAVRRLLCSRCGARTTQGARAALPRSMKVEACSHAHLIVESMDQVSQRRPVVLLRSDEGGLFAFSLCETDASLAPHLIGERLELVLRCTEIGADAPVTYARKAAAGAATRARLKQMNSTTRKS